MKTVRTVASLRENLAAWRRFDESVALVPTMGNLHQGHLSLVERAQALADRTVVSVFVNPTQFGPGEDYASYPRTLDSDRRKLTRAGVDILFAPDVGEIYPRGEQSSTRVSVPALSGILCGQFRPGHFDGVSSVVTRLFNIVQPQVAVFGQKDYQQLVIIRRLQSDLHLPVEIVGAPTQREADGLALSSRNQYLDPSERQRAPVLHQVLLACGERILAGARRFSEVEKEGVAALTKAGFRVDYLAVRSAEDLSEPGPATRRLVILAAAHLGRARLIDNLPLELPASG